MGQAAHVDIVLVRQANRDDQFFHIDVQRVDILVEKTRISFERISLRFYNRRLMFRSAMGHLLQSGRRKERDQG